MNGAPDEVLAALDDVDNFVIVPRAALRALPPREAIALCWLRYRGQHEGWVDTSTAELAAEIGLTADQMKRAISVLVEEQLVEWREPQMFSRRRQYRVARRCTSAPSEGAHLHAPDGADVHALPLQEDLDLLVKSAPARSPFDAFWSEYPRKIDRGKAQLAFNAALRLRPQPDIAAGLERWLVYWRATGDVVDGKSVTSYVPHPTTWLHGRRWEAEPPPPQSRQNGAQRARPARPSTITDRSGESGVIEL